MFDKWTDRARKAMNLAQENARRLGHEYIGTEHILLGVIEEGKGIACNVLKNLSVSREGLVEDVMKMIFPCDIGKIIGRIPMTPRAKKVCEYADDKAKELGHNYVGTEHVLMGMLAESEGIAGNVLSNRKVTLNSVIDETLNLLGHSKRTTDMAQDRLTEQDLLDILEAAEKRPYFKWLMARKVMNMSMKEVTELEQKFGSLLGCFEPTPVTLKTKIEGNTITAWHEWKHAECTLGTINLDDLNNCNGMNELQIKPKVDDTQEFHLVRCPKCELMVEELVATPYRHVCANCAKGE